MIDDVLGTFLGKEVFVVEVGRRRAVEKGYESEDRLHAEEVGVEDWGVEELVYADFCGEGEDERGVVVVS